jgi:hypothetical protein
MNRRLYSFFVVAAATAGLVAGCGGSGKGGTTASNTTTSTSTTSSSSTGTVPNIPAGEGGAVAAYCSTALTAAKNLTAAEKTQFQNYCAAFKNDNPTQIKAAEKTLCIEIIKDEVPSGEQSAAEAECSKL